MTGTTMHAYVINLERSADRRAHIAAELSRAGLDYDIVTAVDGRDVDLEDVGVIDPSLVDLNAFPAGAAGCALSHLRVYERVLADGREHALVLEDDVVLPADLREVLDAVAPLLTGAEVALLNYGSQAPCRMSPAGAVALPSSRLLALPVDVRPVMNAAAYVITREACRRLHERGLPLRANADDWQFFYRQGLLDRVRCVVPLAVGKSPRFESTIGAYSLGSGVKARLLRPLLQRRIPLVSSLVHRRRRRIMREWERSEVVDVPFVVKASRLD